MRLMHHRNRDRELTQFTLLVVGLALASLAGCHTTAPPASARAVPGTADQVAGCKYLDDVASVSSRYGIFASAALDDTRAQVLMKAGELGATHLVWEAPVLVYGSTTSRGKAYRCS